MMAASDAGRSPDGVGAALARPCPLRWRRRMTEVFRLAARACPAVTPMSVERPAAGDLAAARAASTVNRRPPLRWRRRRFAAMDAGRGRDRGIAWRARNAGAAMPRPAPSVNVADISTNCATEPANFVGRLIAIRSLSRRRVRHRHPAVEADREPQSCRRHAESRRASAANKYSIASMHAPSRTGAHRGGTGPGFGSGLTGPHRMTATAGRFDL
ncbi:hypothetical protein [Burkholderia pseudomallei]|uniref:hypothetical protein n=1 Tax=Burkholderia pseudomallei TaxID=28450 RepID=UPI0013783F50|nr:hypothetical protein [Burkholderia pseudomallei]